MEYFKINHDLLNRVIEIKVEEQRPLKRGFKTWLKYVRTWKVNTTH